MKKILFLTIGLILGSILLGSQLVFAGNTEEGADCKLDSECKTGLLCYQEGAQLDPDGKVTKTFKRCRDRLEVLTQRPPAGEDGSKNIKVLPNVSVESALSLAIKTILRSAMLLTIIALVVAAIYYMTSRGKEEDITKAKDIILYLIIGMAVMAASYGVVAGLTRFNVFE